MIHILWLQCKWHFPLVTLYIPQGKPLSWNGVNENACGDKALKVDSHKSKDTPIVTVCYWFLSLFYQE